MLIFTRDPKRDERSDGRAKRENNTRASCHTRVFVDRVERFGVKRLPETAYTSYLLPLYNMHQ